MYTRICKVTGSLASLHFTKHANIISCNASNTNTNIDEEMKYSSSNHSVSFSGKIIETTVTNNPSVADHWLRSVLLLNPKTAQKIIPVGFDCKFNPHPIPSMSNKIATLQLSIETKCLILQLVHMDCMPQCIKNLFDDKRVTFFGVRAKANAAKLCRDYGLKFWKIIDIRDLVKIWFPIRYSGECSLKGIAYHVAGLKMRRRKKNCGIDWEARVLDVELIECACVDAYALYKIAHVCCNDLV